MEEGADELMRFPLSFRSNSTWALLFLTFIGLLILGDFYIRTITPDIYAQYELSGGAFVALFLLVGYSIIGARLKGPPHPHAIITCRMPPSGNPQTRDFFFAVTDPIKNIMDVVYLGDVDEATGEEIPFNIFGQLIFPYIARTAWGIYWDGLGEFFLHMFVLTESWNDFHGHHNRPKGAFVLGEEIDHGNSDCLTVYMPEFFHSILDLDVPIYFGAEGTSTYLQVTRSWKPTMKVIARMDMDQIRRDHASDIWPMKEIDEIVAAELTEPEKLKLVAAQIARSKKQRGS